MSPSRLRDYDEKRIMLAIGLDCSGHNVGWAITDETGGISSSGVEVFKIKRGQSVGLIYHAYMNWLDELVKKTVAAALGTPVIVGYEVAHFRGGHATEMAVALQTRAQEIAAVRGCIAAPVHTSTVKKFATGHGHANKDDMIAHAQQYKKRGKLTAKDDDEADAIHIARWAYHTYLVEPEILQPTVCIVCDDATGVPVSAVFVDTATTYSVDGHTVTRVPLTSLEKK